MAYITLEELKEILPGILDQWIDEDDEGWEWIFQEIEQKCHVGKRCKGKKWKKKIEDYISALKEDICDLNDWHSELNKKYDELRKQISTLDCKITAAFIDARAAKFAAQTAKQRTEVDYSKYSQKDNKCASCKYKNKMPFDQPCVDCYYNRGIALKIDGSVNNNNNKWEAEEIPTVEKMCKTCKYNNGNNNRPNFNEPPCNECNHNDKWEAKENE